MSITKPHSPHRAARLPVLLAGALAVTVSVAVLAGGLLGSDGATPTGRPDLQRILDDVVAGRHRLAPGATAFVSGPRGTWVGSAGVADIATRDPMRSGARMRLQSISKIYTAALILQLAQERRLDVGDTVERWLPGVLPYGGRITIRQLLMMRSGLIDLADVMRQGARYLGRRIFEPLGLRQTAYDPQGPIGGLHARGYLIGADGKMTDATNWHWGAGAAAGIVSNAPETAALLVALMRGRLLERHWLETMREDIWHGGSPSGCAGNAYGWGGAGDAYKTDAFVNTDGSRVAVLLLNARRYDGRDDMTAMRRMIALYCAA